MFILSCASVSLTTPFDQATQTLVLNPKPLQAPECFNDKLGGVSTKCDIFSLGVILVSMWPHPKQF